MDDSLEFGLVYNVYGNALDKLKEIRKEQAGIAQQAASTARASTRAEERIGQQAVRPATLSARPGAATALPGGGSLTVNVRAFSEPFERGSRAARSFNNDLQATVMAANMSAQALQGVGDAAMTALALAAGKGVEIARTVEDANARSSFAAGKLGADYDKVIEKIDEVSLRSTMTRNDLSEMFSNLAIQGIDIFHDKLDDLTVTAKDGTKVTTDAMLVIQDAMSFSGRNLRRVLFSIKEAASEQRLRAGKQLAEDLNISAKELDKWNTELAKASDNQDAFNRLMALMAERVGGAAAATAHTLTFVIKQIDDWRDKFVSSLFMDTLPVIRDFISDVGKEVLDLTRDGGLDDLRDEITAIAQELDKIARKAVNIALIAVNFAKANPDIIRTGVHLAAIAFAVGRVMSGLSALGALVFNLKNLFSLLGPAIALPLIKFGAIALAISTVATAAAHLVVGGKSVMDTWGRVGDVVSALFEAFKNMDWVNGITFIDEESAKKLEGMGLLDEVINISRVAFRLSKTIDGILSALEERWPAIEDAFLMVFESIKTSVRILAEELGLNLSGAADDSVDSWAQFGVDIGFIIAELTIRTLEFTDAMYDLLNIVLRCLAAVKLLFNMGSLIGAVTVPGASMLVGDMETNTNDMLVASEQLFKTGTKLGEKRQALYDRTRAPNAFEIATNTQDERLMDEDSADARRTARSRAVVRTYMRSVPEVTFSQPSTKQLQTAIDSMNNVLEMLAKERKDAKGGKIDDEAVERIARAAQKGIEKAHIKAIVDGNSVSNFVNRYANDMEESGM